MQNNPVTNVTIEFCNKSIQLVAIDGHDITRSVEHVGVSAKPNSRSCVVLEIDPDVLKVSGDPYISKLVHRVIIDEPERFTIWQRIRGAFQAAWESMKA